MRSQHTSKLASLALAIACGIGMAGCQRTYFPSNPFAGKLPSLPVPKMLSGKLSAPPALPLAGKLPIPKLPGLSSIPRPNFGNLVRTATTPAADAIAARSSTPPPAPPKTFDTSSADQQIAASRMPSDIKSKLEVARKAAEASRENIETAQDKFNTAVASTTPPSSGNLFSRINTKPAGAAGTVNAAKPAVNQTAAGNLWGNYKPDTRPGSSNRPDGGIEELAKVNPRLYDRYGKLTTSNGVDSGQFVATNPDAKRDFDFPPAQDAQVARQSPTADKVSSDNPDATIAGLRSQLMELRSRGSGTSDQFKLPHRSAFEIAGLAPQKPVAKEPEQPLHRGFGNAADLGERQQTVSIPDPTAPTNILRAIAPPTPGLVATKEINTGLGRSNTSAGELPRGNMLSGKRKSASPSEDIVSNDFVGGAEPSSVTPPPTLRASAHEPVQDMQLPRQLSQASLDALEAAKQARLNQPLPEVNRAPLAGGFQNPKVAPHQFPLPQQPPVTMAASPSAFPAQIRTQVSPQLQVTRNQFFDRAAEPAPTPEKPSASAARVAKAPSLSIGTAAPPRNGSADLPDGLNTGSGNYAPGSVRSLEKKLW